MSDSKPKSRGRGRGKSTSAEGPWSRSKKLDESRDVRPPRKEGFDLSDNSFPPLPGAASEQFTDSLEDKLAATNLNGGFGEDTNIKSTQETKDSKEENSFSLPELRSINKESLQNGNSEQAQVTKTDNHHKTAGKKRPLKSVEHDHEKGLRLQDLQSSRPAEIVYLKSGEKLLVKPSGRKYFITEEGTLGERKYALDDLRRSFLFTQEHLNRLLDKREKVKQQLIRQLDEKLHIEKLTYRQDFTKVDISNSNLSPYATEFVPRANMNPEARDFVPTSTNSNYDETNNNRTSVTSNFNVNDTEAILADLEETVSFCYLKLMETPASYDELMGVVTPHFIKYMENPDLPNAIVQMLYSYAISDTSFSYFAVKILIHLIKETSVEDFHPLRDATLRHAQEEVKNTKEYRLSNPDMSDVSEIQPFLMFLSELYIQLEVGGMRLKPVGHALLETLRKLQAAAHIPLKERLRLIVNILKLTGLALDQDDSTYLDSLFAELGLVVEQESATLDSPTIQIVNDIILLRNLRWGLVEPEDYLHNESNMPISPNGNQVFSQANGYEPTYDPNVGYTSGVFYGPDGNPIDYEEQLFLEVETNALNQQLLDQGEPSPTSVEGYDEAYEEFLKTVPGHSSKN